MLGVLVVAAPTLLAEAWTGAVTRLPATGLGRIAVRAAVNIGVAVLLAWILWQMVKLGIDRHLAADESIEAGTLKGTVENISLPSMRLRDRHFGTAI